MYELEQYRMYRSLWYLTKLGYAGKHDVIYYFTEACIWRKLWLRRLKKKQG